MEDDEFIYISIPVYNIPVLFCPHANPIGKVETLDRCSQCPHHKGTGLFGAVYCDLNKRKKEINQGD
jgi:hypothetical protein